MHDKHYPLVSYRLNDKTKQNINNLHRTTGLTYNLLFVDMIKKYLKNKTKANNNLPDSIPNFD